MLTSIYNFCFDDKNKANRKCTCCWVLSCLFGAGVILMIVLLVMCVNKKIDQSEVGVFKNYYTSSLRGPYEQGTYVMVPGETLTTFPRVYQQRSHDKVVCLTKDTLPIKVDVAMQYQYDVNLIIPQLLQQFDNEDNFMELFDNTFYKAYLISCSKYTAEQFNNIRSQIEADIYTEMSNQLHKTKIGVDVQSLQLVHTYFPNEFIDIITSKQATIQSITTNLNSRSGQLTEINTSILQAKQQANINLINANNIANINTVNADIKYNITLNKWQQQGIAFLDMLQAVNNNKSTFLYNLQFSIIKNATRPVINLENYMF